MNHSDNTSFLQNVLNSTKDNVGSVLTGLCSLILAGVIAFGNSQHNGGANEAKQVEIERRIALLENDKATRDELKAVNERLGDFKGDMTPRLVRIENLLLQLNKRR